MRPVSQIQSMHDLRYRASLGHEATDADRATATVLSWVLDPRVPDLELAIKLEGEIEGDHDRCHEQCCPSDGSCCEEVHCEQVNGKCSHCSAVHCGSDSRCIAIEGTGVPLIPDIDALRALWVGKYVRTSRILTREEYRQWVGDPDRDYGAGKWHEGYDWGGAGVVAAFYWERGSVWLLSDEGLAWRIDAQTTISQAMDLRTYSVHEEYARNCGCTLRNGCYQCCRICNADAHRCPGCGAPTLHDQLCCPECRSDAAKKASA